MRSFNGLLAVCALACGGSADGGGTQTPAPVASDSQSSGGSSMVAAAETPTEVRELGPTVDDGEAVGAWIAQRIAQARDGVREYVRLPLAEQADALEAQVALLGETSE
jgi:hypothetical protein